MKSQPPGRSTATAAEGKEWWLEHQPDWHQLKDGSWVYLPPFTAAWLAFDFEDLEE